MPGRPLKRPLRYTHGLPEVPVRRSHADSSGDPALSQQSAHLESSADDTLSRHPCLPRLRLVGVFDSALLAFRWMAGFTAAAIDGEQQRADGACHCCGHNLASSAGNGLAPHRPILSSAQVARIIGTTRSTAQKSLQSKPEADQTLNLMWGGLLKSALSFSNPA